MTSSRRPFLSGKGPNFSRTIFSQSGTAHLHDAVDGSGERVRARALVGEDSAAGVRQTVIAPGPPELSHSPLTGARAVRGAGADLYPMLPPYMAILHIGKPPSILPWPRVLNPAPRDFCRLTRRERGEL